MSTERINMEVGLPFPLEKAARRSIIKKVISLLGSRGWNIEIITGIQRQAGEFVERKFGQLVYSWLLYNRAAGELDDTTLSQLPESQLGMRRLGIRDQNQTRGVQLRGGQLPAVIQPDMVYDVAEKLIHSSSYVAYLHWNLITFCVIIQEGLRSNHPLNEKIRDDAIFRLRGLAKHPFVTLDTLETIEPLVRINDRLIAETAKIAVEEIKRRIGFEPVPATVQWISEGKAVAQFEHPQFGIAEREFNLAALPTGAIEGDIFQLQIDRDANGRVCGYIPRKDLPLTKRVIEEWETVPEPELPKDLDDEKAMNNYKAKREAYLKYIRPLRLQAESRGWPKDGK